jgi:hypothetical protein
MSEDNWFSRRDSDHLESLFLSLFLTAYYDQIVFIVTLHQKAYLFIKKKKGGNYRPTDRPMFHPVFSRL